MGAPIDKKSFDDALVLCAARRREQAGIGTYNEKSMHQTLKFFYEPDEDFHEIRVSGIVADICKHNRIIEIQTRDMRNMAEKIPKYITAGYEVKVVVPLIAEKRIMTMNPKTGAISEPRKSPKKQSIYSILHELWYIRESIFDSAFTLDIVSVSVDEYRRESQNERGKYSRKGYFLIEQVPTGLCGITKFSSREEYSAFVPEALGEFFTTKDLKNRFRLGGRSFSMALDFLIRTNLITKCGKKGNAFIYTRPGALPRDHTQI